MSTVLIFMAGLLTGSCLCAIVAVVALSRGAKELQEWEQRNGKRDLSTWKADPVVWNYRQQRADGLRRARVGK